MEDGSWLGLYARNQKTELTFFFERNGKKKKSRRKGKEREKLLKEIKDSKEDSLPL